MEGTGIFAQQIWGPATHNDRIPLPANLVHGLLHHRHHAVGIEHLIAQTCAAFVTAAPEGLGEAVKAAVHALVAAHNGGGINLGKVGNFFGEELVPELPAQMLGQSRGNRGAAAAVLALDGNEAKHNDV